MAYTQFQHRRDTAANWSSNNPTLAAGELGLDTTSKRFKIGDGSTAWNSLVYANDSESLIFVLTEGNAFVGTELATLEYVPFDLIITELILSVSAAPTGANLISDLNVNGSSILSTKISIDATELDSTTATTPYVLSTTAISKGDRVSVDIDQIGATLPGVSAQLIVNAVRV